MVCIWVRLVSQKNMLSFIKLNAKLKLFLYMHPFKKIKPYIDSDLQKTNIQKRQESSDKLKMQPSKQGNGYLKATKILESTLADFNRCQ